MELPCLVTIWHDMCHLSWTTQADKSDGSVVNGLVRGATGHCYPYFSIWTWQSNEKTVSPPVSSAWCVVCWFVGRGMDWLNKDFISLFVLYMVSSSHCEQPHEQISHSTAFNSSGRQPSWVYWVLVTSDLWLVISRSGWSQGRLFQKALQLIHSFFKWSS